MALDLRVLFLFSIMNDLDMTDGLGENPITISSDEDLGLGRV